MFKRHGNPPGRFDRPVIAWDEEPPIVPLQVVPDRSRSVLVRNDSPDVGFTWSLNPYRGCTHGCAYCYARAFHEYLDLGAGSDFERIVAVKSDAPDLLREAFERPSWRGEPVAFSGVTDCYQPLEALHEITRRCLAVCLDYRNPVGVVTRSPLVTRDLDLLGDLARRAWAMVTVSVPIADRRTARLLEPGAPPPEARFAAIRALADAGVPVGASLAPVIPGLTDHAIPDTLRRVSDAGGRFAFLGLLRLTPSVAEVFEERLRHALPGRAETVLARLRRSRGGALHDPRFGDRMVGSDESWAVTERLFALWCDRLGLGPQPSAPEPSPFRRPGHGRQLTLL